MATNFIQINVGGTVFSTTKSTLLGAGSPSFFGVLLSEDWERTATKDQDGRPFIDRDAAPFEIILSFLRTGKWNPPASFSEFVLRDELDFYGISLPAGFGVTDDVLNDVLRCGAEEPTEQAAVSAAPPVGLTAQRAICRELMLAAEAGECMSVYVWPDFDFCVRKHLEVNGRDVSTTRVEFDKLVLSLSETGRVIVDGEVWEFLSRIDNLRAVHRALELHGVTTNGNIWAMPLLVVQKIDGPADEVITHRSDHEGTPHGWSSFHGIPFLWEGSK